MNNFLKSWIYSLTLVSIIAPVLAKDCSSSSSSSCSSSSSSNCSDKCSSSSSSCSSSDCNNHCNKKETTCGSRTILVPRSQTLDAMNELALNDYFLYHNSPDTCPMLHTQVSYFHKQSQKAGDLRRYFLKDNKDRLTIRENGTGDIGSLWLNLISPSGSNYSSDISICPQRKLDGGYFNFWADLNRLVCGGWAAISFAAYRSEARTRFHESNRIAQGTLPGFQNAHEAFNNPAWNYGKLSNKCHTRHGVDDVQFKFGWNYYFCNRDHAGLYLAVVAPTGKKFDHNERGCKKGRKHHLNEFIWDPYIGSRHAGVGFGINTDTTLWECGNQGLNWLLDFKYIYRFKAHEHRLFDLRKNGDFSRYLQVVTPNARQNSLPGVNFLNARVEVTPRSLIEFWTALHYEWCMYNFELGYNLFWRDAEKVCLSRKKCHNNQVSNFGIYDITGDCKGNPVSASNARISQSVSGSNVAPSDATFTTVQRTDLDLRSGAQPQALTNTIYAGASYNSEMFCLPTMIGITGSYEFASNHVKCHRGCESNRSSSSSDDCGKKRNHHRKHNHKERIAIEQWGVALKGDIAF